MNKTFIKHKLNSCKCHCHECNNRYNIPECIHMNRSHIISETIEPNLNQVSLNYNYNNPLFNSKINNNDERNNDNIIKQSILLNDIKNEIEKNNLNSSNKFDIRERAEAIKDKINSIFLLKKVNNKNMRQIFNMKNCVNNFTPTNKYTFKENLNFNNRGRTPLYRRKMEKELKLENPHLKKLLSFCPRHEKRSRKKENDERMKLIFTNGIFRTKSYDMKNILNKKFTGYTSMIMPPNSLCQIGLINNC